MTGQRRSARLAAVLGVVLAATLAMAACSSDDNDKTSTSGSAKSSSSSAAKSSSSLDQTAAKAEITSQFKALFDGTNPDLESKLKTIEDPELIRDVFMGMAAQNGDLLKQASADVKTITFTDDTHADVVYDLLLNGAPQLPGQSGGAVLINGKWLVTRQTFCDVAALGNSAVNSDPACA